MHWVWGCSARYSCVKMQPVSSAHVLNRATHKRQNFENTHVISTTRPITAPAKAPQESCACQCVHTCKPPAPSSASCQCTRLGCWRHPSAAPAGAPTVARVARLSQLALPRYTKKDTQCKTTFPSVDHLISLTLKCCSRHSDKGCVKNP